MDKKEVPSDPIRYFGTNNTINPPVEYFIDAFGDIWSYSNDIRAIVGWIQCIFKPDPQWGSCMGTTVLDPNLTLCSITCYKDVEDLYSHGPSKENR